MQVEKGVNVCVLLNKIFFNSMWFLDLYPLVLKHATKYSSLVSPNHWSEVNQKDARKHIHSKMEYIETGYYIVCSSHWTIK